MPETFATYTQPLNQALGRGTFYRLMGGLVAISLAVILTLGFFNITGPNLFTGETAFAIGGLALVVLSASMLVLLFSLTSTIRLINKEMADLAALRESIETSYARLQDATESLGTHVQDLKGVLPAAKKSHGRKYETETNTA
jgi:hypothetical protein